MRRPLSLPIGEYVQYERANGNGISLWAFLFCWKHNTFQSGTIGHQIACSVARHLERPSRSTVAEAFRLMERQAC